MEPFFDQEIPQPSSSDHAAADARRLRLALEISQLGTWSLDPVTERVGVDERMLEILGETATSGSLEMGRVMNLVHPEDRAAVRAAVLAALDRAGQGRYVASFRLLRGASRVCWITVNGQAIFSGEGEDRRVVELIGTARDSTEEKQAEALLLAQKRVLERIAQGEALSDILLEIVQVVDGQSAGRAVSAIMLVDQEAECLRYGAAGHLPVQYWDSIDGIPIDIDRGTCAAAVALNDIVVTPDIENDPKWRELGHLPLALGLKGAWSVPIRGSDGSVLGTLGTYFREVRRPEEREMQVVGVLAETAGLAIEKLAARERLAALTREAIHREGLFAAVASTTPDLVYVFDLQHRFTYANASLLKLWGITRDDAMGKTCLELGYPVWEAELHDREIDEVVRTKKFIKGEGEYAGNRGAEVFEYIFSPIFNASGEVEAVAGMARDITERKRTAERALVLSGLTKRLAGLTTEKEVVMAATEAVGSYVGAHRCYFAEYFEQEDRVVVGPNWLRDEGTTSLQGELNVEDPARRERWLRYFSGNFTVPDVASDPLTRDCMDIYGPLKMASYAVQPFISEGRRTVVLAVTSEHPRDWRPEELALMESVIARAWPLVERIRMEMALRKSEEHMRVVANHAPALISYVDRECRYQFVNDHSVQWFGRQREDMLGKHVKTILGEEIYRDRLPFIERALAGEQVRTEWRLLHMELGMRDVDLALVPYKNDEAETQGFFIMGFDVTEHRRARQSLTERGNRLRLLWESASILLTTDDPDTMLRRLFEGISSHIGAELFFNFTVEESGMLHLRSWHGLDDGEVDRIARILPGQGMCGRVAESRRPLIVPGLETGDADCRKFLIKAYAGYPLMKGGEVFGTLAFASRTRDEFSAGELEFLETISHYVTAAYVRLELVASLREADRRKDEFLATLAHELRNPLAPIRTGIEVLKQVMDRPEKAGAVIGIIERQTAQMVRLIDDLIDVSRITRGKIELRSSSMDLMEALTGAIEAVQPLIDKQGHTLTNALPAGPIFLHGDVSRLSQVFSNLLSNAARYTPHGGNIRLLLETTKDSVMVAVADDGEGIEPEMQTAIFEMFTQLKRPAGFSTEGGLGIGLTLVRLLLHLHGGSISVHSEGAGKGSEFRVTLPRTSVEPMALEDPPESAGRVAAVGCKVLIVDDGASAADMLAQFFILEGFEARTAYGGAEALDIAAEMLPQLVFMDIGMPEMDGNETARRMREIPGCEGVILVALTGWGQEDDRKKTRAAGFDHHLVKPAEPHLLRELLGRLAFSELKSASG